MLGGIGGTGGRALCEEVATVIKDRRDESLNLLSGGIKKSGLIKEIESKINHIHLWMDELFRWLNGKGSTCNAGAAGNPLEDQEDPLEEGTATHSSILAWRVPWMQEPVWQQFIGSQ